MANFYSTRDMTGEMLSTAHRFGSHHQAPLPTPVYVRITIVWYVCLSFCVFVNGAHSGTHRLSTEIQKKTRNIGLNIYVTLHQLRYNICFYMVSLPCLDGLLFGEPTAGVNLPHGQRRREHTKKTREAADPEPRV